MVLSSQGFVHKRHLKYQNVFTLAPNSTRFAKFCTDLATNISVLAAIGDGESEMILNIRGFRMAGQISRRKTKPLTTLVLMVVFVGHLCWTDFCKHP